MQTFKLVNIISGMCKILHLVSTEKCQKRNTTEINIILLPLMDHCQKYMVGAKTQISGTVQKAVK